MAKQRDQEKKEKSKPQIEPIKSYNLTREPLATQQPVAPINNDSALPSGDNPVLESPFLGLAAGIIHTLVYIFNDIAALVCAAISIAFVYVFTRWIFLVVAKIEEASITYVVWHLIFLLTEASLFAKFFWIKLRNDGFKGAPYGAKKNAFRKQYFSLLRVFEIVKLAFDKRTAAKWRVAITYLWVICLFGFIYSLLPYDDFLYANASAENRIRINRVRADTESIGQQLELEIVDAFQKNHGVSPILINEWKLDGSAFKILDIDATRSGDDVEITAKLQTMFTLTSSKNYVDLELTFSAMESIMTRKAGDHPETKIYRTVKVTVPPNPVVQEPSYSLFVGALFPEAGRVATPSNALVNTEPLRTGSMSVSKELDDRMTMLAQAIRGDPAKPSGDFWKMLYLSALTITTRGASDISPLTTRARILITLEVVIGIALMGLFLIALVSDATTKQNLCFSTRPNDDSGASKLPGGVA